MWLWCLKGIPLHLVTCLVVLDAVASISTDRFSVTCTLEIVGIDGSRADAQNGSEGHPVEVGSPPLLSSVQAAAAAAAQAADSKNDSKHLQVSLQCQSPKRPILVMINNNFTSGWTTHLVNFTGVKVVDHYAELSKTACGIGQESNQGILALSSLLYFCDEYQIIFSRLKIEGVKLLDQQQCDGNSPTLTCIVLLGGTAGRSVAANLNHATVTNNVVGSAIAVVGSSHVNISRLECENNTGCLGACIFASGVAVAQVTSSSFFNCRAGRGAAIAGAGSSNISIYDSMFEECSAREGGGAIWAEHECTLTVADSSFSHNQAISEYYRGVGGALGLIGSSRTMLINTSLTDNSAHAGGAVQVSCTTPSCSITFDRCMITNNKAYLRSSGGRQVVDVSDPYGYGGGVNAERASVNFSNSTVIGNFAGMYGGGVSFYESLVGIFNSGIQCNQVGVDKQGWGGGMHADNSDVTLQACQISNNNSTFAGGGMSSFNSNLTVLDSTLTGNKCVYYGGMLVVLTKDTGVSLKAHFNNSHINGSRADSGGCIAVLGADESEPDSAAAATQYGLAVTNTNMTHCSAGFGGTMLLEGQGLLVDLTGSNVLLNASTIVRRDGCCVVGDFQSNDGICSMCSQHMFSFDQMYRQSCSPCPAHATCAGGAVVLADSGFYHLHNLHNCGLDQVYRCEPLLQLCQNKAKLVVVVSLIVCSSSVTWRSATWSPCCECLSTTLCQSCCAWQRQTMRR
jgi:hypothetical protein